MRATMNRCLPDARGLGAAALVAATAVSVAVLTACAVPAPAANPTVDSRLVPGWQDATHALYMSGPAPIPGTFYWLTSSTLPAGTYEVISRRGDTVQVLRGHRLEYDGRPFKDVLMILPSSQGELQLVDARFVSAAPKP